MMRVRAKATWRFAVVGAIVIGTGCGKSSGNPGGPSGGGAATATITITTSGVSPKNVTVARGSQVAFSNTDSRSHEMASDPHPTHGSCPEIESGVGFIGAGQTKLTGNLNTARTCGYHDHNRDADTSLQGTITIQ